jgi:hypothetical protein
MVLQPRLGCGTSNGENGESTGIFDVLENGLLSGLLSRLLLSEVADENVVIKISRCSESCSAYTKQNSCTQ